MGDDLLGLRSCSLLCVAVSAQGQRQHLNPRADPDYQKELAAFALNACCGLRAR